MAERSFLEIAQGIDIPASTWQEAIRGIANLKNTWLLVLDNCDDPDIDYLDYFPEGAFGVIIMTTRNNECQQYATTKSVALDGLSGGDSKDLLLKATCLPRAEYSIHDKDAQIVAKLLQSHPLALIQAGAYVSRGHCSLADYPSVYEQQRGRLLSYRPRQAQSRYKDVYTTFEISANSLKNSNSSTHRDALQLLPILAVCGSSHLPLSLFEQGWAHARKFRSDLADDEVDDEYLCRLTQWHFNHLPPFFPGASGIWDQSRLVEAVSILRSFSLVSTSLYNGHLHVSMHALVQAWARDRQNDTQQHETWLQMASVAAFALSDIGNLSQKFLRQLQTHIEALASWEPAKMFAQERPKLICKILVNVGVYLRQMRAETKLALLLDKVFTHLHLDIMKVEPAWTGLYQLAAECFDLHCKHDKVISILEQVVDIRRQSLPATHPSIMNSESTLASAYKDVGRIKEAVALLEHAVSIGKRALPEDDPYLLISQHVLATAYHSNGDVKKAIALLEHVVQAEARTLAEDDPSRLTSQYGLANAYHVYGDFEKAIVLLEHVVKIERGTLAEDHPDRLVSQHELASIYYAKGDVEKAIALLEHVVKVRERVLAEDHHDQLTSQYVLASAYHSNGDVEKAIALLEHMVEVERRTLAEDDSSRLESQHLLVRVYHTNGDLGKAITLLEYLVGIQERTQTTDGAGSLSAKVELGRLYGKHGDIEQAILQLKKVVNIRKRVLAQDDPIRLRAQRYLATYLWEVGEHHAAHTMMTEVVQVQRKTLRKDHPNQGKAEGWLAFFEREMPSLRIIPDEPYIESDLPRTVSRPRQNHVRREDKKSAPMKHRVLAWVGRHSH